MEEVNQLLRFADWLANTGYKTTDGFIWKKDLYDPPMGSRKLEPTKTVWMNKQQLVDQFLRDDKEGRTTGTGKAGMA